MRKPLSATYKRFTHIEPKIKLPNELAVVTDSVTGIRKYQSPEGVWLPSVTTVLQDHNKERLIEWQEAVGEDKAARVKHQAGVRGTSVHTLLEHYIDNDWDYVDNANPFDLYNFKLIKPTLDKYLDNVVCQEAFLYSNFLRVAGRTDVIADFNGKLSIIDFKTSKRPKKKDWIENYFMQGSAYAVMFEERTGIPIRQVVIIITVDTGEAQVFVVKRDDYIRNYMAVRQSYLEKYGL